MCIRDRVAGAVAPQPVLGAARVEEAGMVAYELRVWRTLKPSSKPPDSLCNYWSWPKRPLCS